MVSGHCAQRGTAFALPTGHSMQTVPAVKLATGIMTSTTGFGASSTSVTIAYGIGGTTDRATNASGSCSTGEPSELDNGRCVCYPTAMMQFEITATNPRPGGAPCTTNMSARTGPDAHAKACAESKQYPQALVTIWERFTVRPDPCGKCGRGGDAFSYRPIGTYSNGAYMRLNLRAHRPEEEE